MPNFQQSSSKCPDQVPGRDQASYDHYPSMVHKVGRGLVDGVVRVLFSDVDATLVLGAGHSENEIAQGQVEMQALVRSLNQKGFIIIPVTGSHLDSSTKTTESIIKRIEHGILPGVGPHHHDRSYTVDAYVSDGGARALKSYHGGTYELDGLYSGRRGGLDFTYEALLGQALGVAARINQQLLSEQERILIAHYDRYAGIDRVSLQPGTQEGHHKHVDKIAFYFYAVGLTERDNVEKAFRQFAEPFGLSVVCCEEKDANSAARRHPTLTTLMARDSVPLKYCLDIVPFTKGNAVGYFCDYLANLATEMAIEKNVARPKLEVWACGDSGNDQPLMAPDIVSKIVVVGGASDELIRYGNRLSAEGRTVFIESNPKRLGPASIAAAVLA